MPNKVRWGVLSTAAIGVKKVLPAMQKGDWVEVSAIASRDLGKAEQVARTLGIAKAYGSYEELLPTRRSRPSTIHSLTNFTSHGRSKLRKRANMSYAKNR